MKDGRDRSAALGSLLLLFFAGLGVVAFAWGLRTFRERRLVHNQNEASRAMRLLHDVQGDFLALTDPSRKPRGGPPWTRDVAGALAHCPDVLPGVPEADVTRGPGVPYHGYFFRALDPGPQDGERGPYAIAAFPAEYGVSGRLTYFINGLGLFSKDTAGRCPESNPTLRELRVTQLWSIID